jgi:hypothetical protein
MGDHLHTLLLQMKHTLKTGDETNARCHGSPVSKFTHGEALSPQQPTPGVKRPALASKYAAFGHPSLEHAGRLKVLSQPPPIGLLLRSWIFAQDAARER